MMTALTGKFRPVTMQYKNQNKNNLRSVSQWKASIFVSYVLMEIEYIAVLSVLASIQLKAISVPATFLR